MKKSFILLCVTMLLMLSVENLKAQGLQNIPCSGFNQKIVAYGTGSALSTTTSQIDGLSYVFMDSTFTAGGTTPCITSNFWKTTMPTSGGSGLTYTLQSTTVNNVLQVSSDSTGTLTLTTPVYATNLYVLNLGGGNSGSFTVTVTFADSTTQTFTNLNLNDWCSGTSPVTTKLYRIPQTATDCSTADSCTYMYETNLAISVANQSKKITSISFTNTTTTQTPNPLLNVFAVGGYVLTACATPQRQPTALALNPGYTSVAGSFTAATGTPSADHYLIVRGTSATLGANPVNGITYTAGSSIGNGTVVSYQTTTSFVDTALLKLTQYYYFVFSSNANCAVGPVYFTTTPLTGNTTTNGQTAYTASGTWVCPAGVTSVNIQCWGGGGGGGSRNTNGAGGGGGGGAFAAGTITVVPGTTYPVTVGAGGTATNNGANSTFKTAIDSIVAAGGQGVPLNDSIGSAGGAITACYGATIYAGGNGGNGVFGSYSGGGGGGAGSTGAGGNATGVTAGTGTTLNGGNGGAGRTTQGTGTAGSTDGGGGGGGYRTSSNTRAGGAGARGYVIVTIPMPPCTTPINQPTVLNLTPTYNSVTGLFTASTDNPAVDHYLILRSTLSTFTATPANGATYTVGNTSIFPGAMIVAYITGTSFTDTGLIGNTTYYYFIYASNSICTNGPNYLAANPLTGNVTTDCSKPLGQPTVLALTPSLTSIDGSFTASASADNYLIVRSISPTLTASPVNGTSYAVDSSFGGGTIIAYQTSTTFTDYGLNPGTKYYYFIFAANSMGCTGGPTYLTVSPLTGNAITNCGTPANQPTVLVLTSGTATVSGSFTATVGTPGADHYLIVRSTDTALTTAPVNDTLYNAGDSFGNGVIVAYQTGTTFTDNGPLTSGTQYYYFIFAANSSNCTNGPAYLSTSPLTGNVFTNCDFPANQPTALSLTPGLTTINGIFTASTGTPGADHYLIIRSTSATLTAQPVGGTIYNVNDSIGGGTVLGYQTDTTFNDTNLNPGTIYYYFIYAANSACPGGVAYLITAPLTGNIATNCGTPANQPTVLTLVPAGYTVSGSFTASVGTPGADHYLIVRTTNSTLSAPPVNTIVYTAGTSLGGGVVVAYQTGTTFTDNGPLVPATQYYYFVFAANSSSCTNGPAYLDTAPLNGSTTTVIHDIYVTTIVTPSGLIPANTAQTVSMWFKNEGTVAETTFPVGYQVNTLTPVTATWTGNIPSGDSVQYTFTTKFTSPNAGTSFTLCAYANLSTDMDTANNKICETLNLTGVGINENTASYYVKLSPNPVRDKLNINCSFIKKGAAKFTVYDIQGAKLYVDETVITTDNFNKVIDVSYLKSGIYFLKVENDSGNTTNKFIIE